MINELGQVLFKDSPIGIFPVGGGKFSTADTVDIRFDPGMNAFRANFLVKHVLTTLLKKIPEPRSLEIWVPLSFAEAQKRKRGRLLLPLLNRVPQSSASADANSSTMDTF